MSQSIRSTTIQQLQASLASLRAMTESTMPKRRERRAPHGSGRNGYKRRRRAAMATLKGCPGGWKMAIRVLEAEERARASA